ncbi:DNA-3-methyladenine glycosylase [Lacticaseibacillus paracasei]|nr:DNA-3-methyladenine glycosylase [Lacticaseibacillus paracasei]
MKTVNSEVKMTTYTIQLVTQPTPPQLDRIMAIWLQGNLQTHDFIPADYWTGNVPLVRDQISKATLWLVQDQRDHDIIAFCGLQDNYIAGFFVDEQARGRGVGAALMAKLQQTYPKLTLAVYQQNIGAARFYRRHGFTLLKQDRDETTGQLEDVLVWQQPR